MNETEIEKLEWSALEYEERERSRDWFWALGTIVLASSIASIIYGNYFFAILVVLGGVLLGFFAIKKPDVVFYELNSKGLKIGSHLYPYENISAFHIQEGPNPMLFIHSERFFMPIISIPVHQDSAAHIHDIFTFKNIKEEEMRQHTSEKIMDSFGL